MTSPLRTVLIGFGNVAAGYAEDQAAARYYRYATHAQVLVDHPEFDWGAVIDVSEKALERAHRQWAIRYLAKSAEELVDTYEPEVAVIATPPDSRLEAIERLPTLRAVLVEKPLGLNVAESQELMQYCERRGLLVQVNTWRRADEAMRGLAAGRLEELVGKPQAIFGLYGNGLLNNGIHLVDLAEFLFGAVEGVQAVGGVVPYPAGPIPSDVNIPFTLRLRNQVLASFQALRYEHFRESYMDVWGEKGRLTIMQEGLEMVHYSRRQHRAMLGEYEVASDEPVRLGSTAGEAFYHVYSNLAAAVRGEERLWSPGEVMLRTATVIDAVIESAYRENAVIELGKADDGSGVDAFD